MTSLLLGDQHVQWQGKKKSGIQHSLVGLADKVVVPSLHQFNLSSSLCQLSDSLLLLSLQPAQNQKPQQDVAIDCQVYWEAQCTQLNDATASAPSCGIDHDALNA